MRLLLFYFCMLWMTAGVALPDYDRQEIENRIQPIGQVRVQDKAGIKTAEPAAAVTTVTKDPGQNTYESRCIVCHADGIAGAPKFRNASDWGPRTAKLSIDELVGVALKGLNAMPPKGTCGECSEEDIKKAIQYMLPRK